MYGFIVGFSVADVASQASIKASPTFSILILPLFCQLALLNACSQQSPFRCTVLRHYNAFSVVEKAVNSPYLETTLGNTAVAPADSMYLVMLRTYPNSSGLEISRSDVRNGMNYIFNDVLECSF